MKMKHSFPLPVLVFSALVGPLVALSAHHVRAQDADASRVIALGGTVTEIVYALGQQDRLVARDSTSSFPPEVMDLPDVGYVRQLSPEGVLSVGPDLILAESGAGPVETVDVLQDADLSYVVVPDGFTPQAVYDKITVIGAALEVPEAADRLVAEVEADFAEALSVDIDTPRRVLFILSTSGGRIMASGTGTSADGMIALAGGINVMSDFEGWKQVSDEAIITAAPEVIVMMDRGGDHGAADDELVAMPAIAPTPVAQTRSIVRMNGLFLLGFGPRTPQAIIDLRAAIAAAG